MVAQSDPLLDVPPEVKLARRLIERRHLVPPIDVESILQDYAAVEYVDFPVVIDGLCLDLKAPGKRPTVLVRRRSASVRRRFTLAHELAHVLIPWHIGSIIDLVDVTATTEDAYSKMEAEANRFASELLMPTVWVCEQFAQIKNPVDALLHVARMADVSLQAALIKFVSCMPPNFAVARSEDGRVSWSSRSAGTLAATVQHDTDLDATNPYPFPCQMWKRTYAGSTYHIWHFTTLPDFGPTGEQRPWREILDEIVSEIVPDQPERQKFKASINGVTSNANGMVRQQRSHNGIATAMLQRLHASAVADWRYKEFVNHPQFHSFCHARASDYARK